MFQVFLTFFTRYELDQQLAEDSYNIRMIETADIFHPVDSYNLIKRTGRTWRNIFRKVNQFRVISFPLLLQLRLGTSVFSILQANKRPVWLTAFPGQRDEPGRWCQHDSSRTGGRVPRLAGDETQGRRHPPQRGALQQRGAPYGPRGRYTLEQGIRN